MESEANYVFVGAVVVVFSVLILAAVLWLSEAGGSRNVDLYSIYFQNHSLDGLQKDGDITMKGIKIGSVRSLQISEKNIEQVKVVIRVAQGTPVRTDTKALIRRNLLTGIASIDLARGTKQSSPLTYVPPDEDYPVIPEGRSDLDKIANTIPSLVEEANEMVSRINTFFSEENVKSFRNIITNTEKATLSLAEATEDLDELFGKMATASERVTAASIATENFSKNSTIRVDQVSGTLVNTLQQFGNTAASVGKSFTEMSKSVTATSHVINQEITTVGQNVSEAAQAFSATLEGFEDPQAILLGPKKDALGPGEKIPE